MGLYPRHALTRIEKALEYSRVTLLLGPRQSGKSTIAGELARSGLLDRVISLDGADELSAATTDPVGMISGISGPVAIDEIQRAPDLLLEIKRRVDRDTGPGQFLLTGSANILTAPRVLDALTGRTNIVNLWPLASDEIAAGRGARPSRNFPGPNLIDALFHGDPPQIYDAPVGRAAWVKRALAGGYPEVLERPLGAPREEWFRDMIASFVGRDLRDITDARRLEDIPMLLRAIAGQVGSPLVISRLSQRSGMPRSTIDSYLSLLGTGFMIRKLHSWRPGIAGRERRAPKVIFTDPGVLGYLLEADPARVEADSQTAGALFENFVAMEIVKLAEWAERSATLLHFRRENEEIDFVLESRSGEFVAIEAKAAATVGPADRRALTRLRDARSDTFRAGIVAYTGPNTVALGERLWAVPVSALWEPSSSRSS